MAEMQYFKFNPIQWMTGRIRKCSWKAKGHYMDLCCIYFAKDRGVTVEEAREELEDSFDELIEKKIIKIDGDLIRIQFIDEQIDEFEFGKKMTSEAGRIGNLKRHYPLIYAKFKDNQLTIEQAWQEVQRNKEDQNGLPPDQPPNHPPITTQSDSIQNRIEEKRRYKKKEDIDQINDNSLAKWNKEQMKFIDNLSDEHRDFWFIKEGENSELFMRIWRWIRDMERNDIIHLSGQLKYYKKIVEETGRFKCNIKTWMDEKWNEGNYKSVYYENFSESNSMPAYVPPHERKKQKV